MAAKQTPKKAPAPAPKTVSKKTTAPVRKAAPAVVDDDDFEVIQTADLKPFADWSTTPMIEGVVQNPRQVTGQYGAQDVVDVGAYTVGLVAALSNLTDHVGEYIRITCEGKRETKKGNHAYAFTIQRKKSRK
ncbi:MAG: hypothetical protein PHT59_07815 [Candidatus Omnitrophica bacterium]|nr:hypothetical protein [Candidatus Omnitrophota bacterium]